MAQISTYPVQSNIKGDDKWIGSASGTNDTKNFTPDDVAHYYSKTGSIDAGLFAWGYYPYSFPNTQPDGSFWKEGYTGSSIDIINLAGVIRVSSLTLANTTPGVLIQDQWIDKYIMLHMPETPSKYAVYLVTNVTADGDYYLMTLSFVEGRSGSIQGSQSVLFSLYQSSITSVVNSVFGRDGNVIAEDGDYDTSLVPENGRLYFTEARVLGTDLAGFVSGPGVVSSSDNILTAIQKLDGNVSGNSGYLGSIAYDAAAPTPGLSGFYEFSTEGVCTWFTSGAALARIGDRVSITYTAPSTYVYTLIAMSLAISQHTGLSTVEAISQKTTTDIIGNDCSWKYDVLNKFIWGSTGVETTNVDYDSTDFLPCLPTDLISVRLPDNSAAGYAFYDSGNVFISGGTGDGLANAKSYITPPAGTAFLRVCKLKVDPSFLTIFAENSLYNQVKEVFPLPVQNTGTSTTDTISQKVTTDIIGDDISSAYTVVNNFINSTNGNQTGNFSYYSTPYIPCVHTDLFIAQLPDNSLAGYAFYDSGNIFISGGTGEGLANAKIAINVPAGAAYMRVCKLITDPAFLVKYSDKSIVEILREVPTPQVELLNGISSTFDLAAELAIKDIVIIPEGTWTISSTINVPSGKKIYGIRGKSILQASSGVLKVLNLTSVSNVSISGILIKGVYADVDPTDTSKIANKEQALAENGAGTKYGIYIESSNKITIDDVEVRNFDYCGIYVKTIAGNYINGITISSSYLNNNYIGLKLADSSEYSIYSGLHINTNEIGLVVESANNNVQSSSITKNVFGIVVKAVGVNTGHGSISNSMINHNTVMALYVDTIDSGYIIDGCNIHYPETNTIYLKNASGVIISSMNLYGRATVEGGGGNMLVSSNFRIVGSTITLVGTTYLSLKNNIYVNGSNPSAINN